MDNPSDDQGQPAPLFDGGDTGCGELLLDLLLFMKKQPAGAVVRVRALDPGFFGAGHNMRVRAAEKAHQDPITLLHMAPIRGEELLQFRPAQIISMHRLIAYYEVRIRQWLSIQSLIAWLRRQ